jgi:drug/metabolite transporter (DMT)-like permease
LFGASTPFAKALLGDVDPWLMAALLYLGAGGGLAMLRLASRVGGQKPREASLRIADLPWLGAVVVTGGIAAPVLLMFGLQRTSASSASLLLNVEGVATLVIAWTVFHEHSTPRLVTGAISIFVGAIVLAWSGNDISFDLGALMVIAACLCWAADNNLTRRLSAADPVPLVIIKGVVAGATNLAIALSAGASLPALELFGASLLIGFLGYGVSLVWYVLGLRHLGAARTGAYFALAPFVGAVVAIVLLGDPVTSQFLVATAFMAFGICLHVVEDHAHEHIHEALEHEHSHAHDAHHQHAHGPDDPPGSPHSHAHRHERLIHRHPHFPDLHHQHRHS